MGEILVEQFEYKRATSPEDLYSRFIGPCIVMGAIYGRMGYMFHCPPIGHNFSDHIEPIFEDLRKDVKSKRWLEVYVIGGEVGFNDIYKGEMMAGRRTVLEKIALSGFENCVRVVRWCPPGFAQSLRLILSERRAEIKVCPEEDLELDRGF